MVTALPKDGSGSTTENDKERLKNDVGNGINAEAKKRNKTSSNSSATNNSSSTTTTTATEEGAPPYHKQPPEMRLNAFSRDNLPSIIEIKRKIPKHCFESSVSVSMYYVFKDMVMLACLYYLTDMSYRFLPSWAFWFGVTPLYWLVQGTILFGVFVLGHDCGHGSFSNNQLFNDFMGTLLHSVLLVPYYAWKLSHRNHHKNTGNFEKDEVFYPIEKELKKDRTMFPGFALGLGWFIYLFNGYKPRRVFHFNPYESLFQRHVNAIYITLISLGGWGLCLYYYYLQRGFADLTYFYLVPIFVHSSWLVVITFLHHNDPGTPWYSDHEWSYVRGQLSSIDRDYGWAHDLTHSIGIHQVHHLFPSMPHYHLEEATKHFRTAFPQLVRINHQPIVSTFMGTYMKFIRYSYVDKDSNIHWY